MSGPGARDHAADDRAADDSALRDLLARYADAVTRQAPADVGALFAPDGVWTVTGYGEHHGPAAVEAFLDGLLANWLGIVHGLLSGTLEFDADEVDRASGRWYITEFGQRADGVELFFAGVYHDTYVRTPAGWRFATRRYDSLFRRIGGEVATSPFPTL